MKMKHRCYSIGSQNSAGMNSENPESGIHEADIARTLDATGSSPAGYQGGIAVVELLSGGIHPAIYSETVGALCACDHKGAGSQYVYQDKLVVEIWE